MIQSIHRTVWATLLLVLFSASASALDSEGRPTKHEIAVEKSEVTNKATHSGNFDRMGVVNSLSLSKGKLGVSGQLYGFSSNAKVQTLKTKFGTLKMLKKGMEIGFSFKNQGDQKIITEIRQLQPGTVPQE